MPELHTDKSSCFAKTPCNLKKNDKTGEVIQQNISQEYRELLKAGCKIFEISSHRETRVLIVDPKASKIIEQPEDFTCLVIPQNIEDVQNMIEGSILDDATVTEITING